MNVYVFQAALLCEPCGVAAKQGLTPDEDSDRYPSGPHGQAGGEADSPQHCDACNAFLENPLTSDGRAYVADCIAGHFTTGQGSESVLREWSEFYDIPFEATAEG